MTSAKKDGAVDRSCIDDALSGDARAIEDLVSLLVPVILKRVARAVMKRWQLRKRDTRQEVQDLTQDVFVALRASDGALLRKWDPSLGRSLQNYVGWSAEQLVAARMRRQSWSQESLAEDPDHEPARGPAMPEQDQMLTRDLLVRLHAWLRQNLSARGLEMFDRLFVREESVDQICEQMGLKPDDVYQWRHQLRSTAKRGLATLFTERDLRSEA